MIPHDAMSRANEIIAKAKPSKLSIAGDADFNMASTIGERIGKKMQNAAKVLISEYQP
jgi:hypothetical protein